MTALMQPPHGIMDHKLGGPITHGKRCIRRLREGDRDMRPVLEENTVWSDVTLIS